MWRLGVETLSVNNWRTCTTAPLWILVPDNKRALISSLQVYGTQWEFPHFGPVWHPSLKRTFGCFSHIYYTKKVLYSVYKQCEAFAPLWASLSSQFTSCSDSELRETLIRHNKHVFCFCWHSCVFVECSWYDSEASALCCHTTAPIWKEMQQTWCSTPERQIMIIFS